MKRIPSTLLNLAAAMAVAVPALAYERAAEAPEPPVEPSQLFSVPTGQVVESMDLNLSGTGVLFTESGTRPMATATVGLGGIAQMELGTLALVSDLSKPNQLAAVPAAGLKVYVPLTHYAQGLAVSFQRTGTYEERASLVDYEAKLGEFFAMATLANYPLPEHATAPTAGWNGLKVKAHGGVKYIDAKLEDRDSGARAGYWRPVAGVELWKDDARARVVGELNWLVGLDADRTAGSPPAERLDGNPFPASFEVRVKPEMREAGNAIDTLALTLGGVNGVADVRYDQRWIERVDEQRLGGGTPSPPFLF